MRLHDFTFSLDALKVRLAFAELGVPHETVQVDVRTGEHRTDMFARPDPVRDAPILEDAGLVLREANAILVHLGRTCGGELWPQSARDEVLALQWLFFETTHLSHGVWVLWWSEVVSPEIQRPGSDPVVVADAARRLTGPLDLLETHLRDAPYVGGSSYSLVDCAIGAQIAGLRGTRLDRPDERPRLTAYRERIRARSSWDLAHGEALHEIM